MKINNFERETMAIYITGFICLITYMISLAIWG